jgi:hypothetical protein
MLGRVLMMVAVLAPMAVHAAAPPGRRTALGNATGDLVELDRIMKTQPISFLSGLIVAITAPVILNAASLSWNPSKIAKDNGIVVLAEETLDTGHRSNISPYSTCGRTLNRSFVFHSSLHSVPSFFSRNSTPGCGGTALCPRLVVSTQR